MADYFNDYPQTVGGSRPNYQTVIMGDKKRQKEEFAVRMAPSHLYRWAKYLIPDEDELPCRWDGDHKLYISQYESIIREYFPASHLGRWDVIKDTSLDRIFSRLGLEPIPVQEWEKK